MYCWLDSKGNIMRINPYSKVNFARNFNEQEAAKSQRVTSEVKKVIGLRNFDIIIQGPDTAFYPDGDVGIGVKTSPKALKDAKTLASIGFDSIIRGPGGPVSGPEFSPYDAPVFSQSAVADLPELTTEKWGKILPDFVLSHLVKSAPAQSAATVDYNYALNANKIGLRVAYKNFISSNDPNLEGLKEEFKEFKLKNDAKWLESDAQYEVLSKLNKSDDWKTWKKNGSFHLFFHKKSVQRQKDLYKFEQFVVAKQNDNAMKMLARKGINLIGDRQVAFSNRDVWSHKQLFSKELYLGCPPDYFSKEGQSWGFAFMNPKEMFKVSERGKLELSESGQYLKDVYKSMLENNDRIRIDHAIGLCDPWVYPVGGKALDGHRLMFYEVLREQFGIPQNINEKDLGELLKSKMQAGLNASLGKEAVEAMEKGDLEVLTRKHYISLQTPHMVSKEMKKEEVIKELKSLQSDMVKMFLNSDDPWTTLEKIKKSEVFDNSTAIGTLKNDILNSAYKDFNLKLTAPVLEKYTAVIENIISPTVKEHFAEKMFNKKVDKLDDLQRVVVNEAASKAVIYEDLGVVTKPVQEAFAKMKLPGIMHARYADPMDPSHMYREQNNTRGSLLQVGSHDDASYYKEIKDWQINGKLSNHIKYLTEELNIPEHRKMWSNPSKFFELKLSRMLLGRNSKNSAKYSNEVAVHWQDLMGETFENMRYNTPGQGIKDGVKNWANRMPKNWDDLLFNELIPNHKAVNPLRALQNALMAKKGVDGATRTKLFNELEILANVLEEGVKRLR